MINRNTSYIIYIVTAVTALTYLYFRVNLIENRFLDHDEFQHLNATWNLFNGRVPYKDFFEHHFPWLYIISSFLFTFFASIETNFDQVLSLLKASRYFMQVFFLLCTLLIYKTIALSKKRIYAYLAGFIFFINNILLTKTIEFRPDTPALFFFLLSTYFFCKSLKSQRKNDRHYSYFCYGISILFTQKYLITLPALLISDVILSDKKNIKRLILQKILCLFILIVPFLICCLAYFSIDGLDDFIKQNILMNFTWKKTASHTYHSVKLLQGMPVEIILSVLGICITIYKYIKSKTIDKLNVFFGINIIWFCISLILVPISALQFYLILIPSIIYFTTILFENLKDIYQRVVVLILIVFSNFFITYPQIRIHKTSYRLTQERILHYITTKTEKDDIVFGGNPLFGTFRKHVGPYQFIHEGIFLMMTDKEKLYIENSIMNQIIVPKVITYDFNITLFSQRFQKYIKDNYELVEGTQFDFDQNREIKLLKLKEPLSKN